MTRRQDLYYKDASIGYLSGRKTGILIWVLDGPIGIPILESIFRYMRVLLKDGKLWCQGIVIGYISQREDGVLVWVRKGLIGLQMIKDALASKKIYVREVK